MGIKRTQLTPEMLARMDKTERERLAQSGLIVQQWHGEKAKTPKIDDKLARATGLLERQEQSDFANWLNQGGWKGGYVWHGTHKASTCTVGTPDFVVPVSATTLWIEFKSPGGTLSPDQKNFQFVLEGTKNKLHVVYTASEAIDLVKQTKGQQQEEKES